MTHPELIERITRSLAYMLRHQPEQFDLELDEYGFADMDDVVQALNERLGEPVEEEDVRVAVESGDRVRYEIAQGRIRALYGHSIEVKPGESAKPPTLLYVGVSKGDAERAHKYGLRPGRRSFLHLALNPEDALETGRRTSRDYVVITVNALDAWEEGINFYDRKALFLSDPIPTHFLRVGDVHTDGYGTVEGQRSFGGEAEAPAGDRGRPRDGQRPRDGHGRSGGPRRGGGRPDARHARPAGRESFDRPHDADPSRRHAPAGDDAPRSTSRPADTHSHPPRRPDAAGVGADRRESRPPSDSGRHERRPPPGEFRDDRRPPRGNGAPRDDRAPRVHSDQPQRGPRPERSVRPAHAERAFERPEGPEPRARATSSSAPSTAPNDGGFGLGVFEAAARPPVRPPAPLPREVPPAEKPREAPRPERDDSSSFGAGIE